MNDINSPTNYIEAYDRIILVVGERESGRSTFIRSFNPNVILNYYPRFSGDRKKLITDLGKIKAKSIVGIQTGLPALVENSDIFLKELSLLAKIRKHIYLIEWRALDDNYSKLLSSTYARYSATIFLTTGLSKDAETEENTGGRFSGIGSLIKETPDCFLEYLVLKHNQELAIEPQKTKYNVKDHVPNALPSKETLNAKS